MRIRLSAFTVCATTIALFVQLTTVHGQIDNATNGVLELDGEGGHVELPPNIFSDLDQATVEMWVRWDDFSGGIKRAFNYGAGKSEISIKGTSKNHVLSRVGYLVKF